MSRKNKKTNDALIALIGDLKDKSRSTGAAIWRDVALRLETSRSNWAEPEPQPSVETVADDETILVPGKLLGSGDVSGSPNVAAYSVSASARSKIEAQVGA